MIELKERFAPRKDKVYPLLREERGSKGDYLRTVKKEVYMTIKVTSNSTGVFHRKKG